jgi:hypothetical protein
VDFLAKLRRHGFEGASEVRTELRHGLRHADPRLQPGKDAEGAARVFGSFVQRLRHQHIGANQGRCFEILGKHAHHGHGGAIEQQRAAYGMGVAGHAALPEPIGNHGDAWPVGQIFGGGKTAARSQRHAESFQKIRGHPQTSQAHRVLLVEIAGARAGFERSHLGERTGIVAQVRQLVGEHELVGVERRHHADRHQPVFPRVR